MGTYPPDERTVTMNESTCSECKGEGDTSRYPSDVEVEMGVYPPEYLVYSDCAECKGTGVVEKCVKCGAEHPTPDDETDSYLDKNGWCYLCAYHWRPRTAIVRESDMDGQAFHHYVEMTPDSWARVSMQWDAGGSVEPVESGDLVLTKKLGWCSDGGVVIDGDKFTSLEDI